MDPNVWNTRKQTVLNAGSGYSILRPETKALLIKAPNTCAKRLKQYVLLNKIRSNRIWGKKGVSRYDI
jgi:hypothetical protein